MKKLELFIIGCILVPVPVLFCFVTAWFVSAVLLDEKIVPTIALSGLGVGIIINIAFLKQWVKKAYQMNNKVLSAIYIFYSVGVLGSYRCDRNPRCGVSCQCSLLHDQRRPSRRCEEPQPHGDRARAQSPRHQPSAARDVGQP